MSRKKIEYSIHGIHKTNPVCYRDCPGRSETCHATCERWLVASLLRDLEKSEILKEINKEKDVEAHVLKRTIERIKTKHPANRYKKRRKIHR